MARGEVEVVTREMESLRKQFEGADPYRQKALEEFTKWLTRLEQPMVDIVKKNAELEEAQRLKNIQMEESNALYARAVELGKDHVFVLLQEETIMRQRARESRKPGVLPPSPTTIKWTVTEPKEPGRRRRRDFSGTLRQLEQQAELVGIKGLEYAQKQYSNAIDNSFAEYEKLSKLDRESGEARLVMLAKQNWHWSGCTMLVTSSQPAKSLSTLEQKRRRLAQNCNYRL